VRLGTRAGADNPPLRQATQPGTPSISKGPYLFIDPNERYLEFDNGYYLVHSMDMRDFEKRDRTEPAWKEDEAASKAG
jgi:hypothetical protein